MKNVEIRKPFYKKWWFVLIVISVLAAAIPSNKDDAEKTPDSPPQEVQQDIQAEAKDEEPSLPEEVAESSNVPANPYDGRKAEIYDVVLDRIDSGDYVSTTFTDITVNDDLGEDTEGGFVLLIYADFEFKNSIDRGNSTMRMYADDLVANIANEKIADIATAIVFWKDGYNDRSLKYAYEYKNGGFYISDVAGE